MRRYISRTFGLAATALLLATVAQAQGRDHGKHKHKEHDAKVRRDDDRRRDEIIRESNGDVYRLDRRVPPGLAKKPGRMPPGQYKKRYGAYEGASVLSDVMRQRGYTVLRVVPSGSSRYVYYRLNDGYERRAFIQPGTDRLLFTNVPTSILQAVLARLY